MHSPDGSRALPTVPPPRMARRGRLIPRSVSTLAVILLAVMGCDDAEPPTAPDPTPALATSATIPLVFHQVSATGFHTCGVTTDHRAYCWGHNAGGALGDGTTALRYTPVAVLGGLQFRQISTNGAHTCAITLDNLAYCRGVNDEGQLGDGTLIGRTAPVPVAGDTNVHTPRFPAGEIRGQIIKQ
jgi:Regulator of chromosome condensation (RCC1) repeat